MTAVVALVAAIVAGLAGAVVGYAVTVRDRARRGGQATGSPTDSADTDHHRGLARRSLAALRVGVVVLDPDNQPVFSNPSARAMGLLRAGVNPGTVSAHPVVRTRAGQVRRGGLRREVEVELPRARGEPLAVLLRAVEIGGGYVTVEAADATESHRVDRVRRDFVANVGHELKTPIGALQLLSEALLDATTPGGTAATDPAQDVAAARRFAERIRVESTRLGRLVSELLELSRLEGAEPQPPPTPVSVDAVVAEVLDRGRTGAAARGITLTGTGQPGLTVYGSESQLVTALSNLVENAVAYSPEGSEVTVTTGTDGDEVVISVADRGIGIAPEDLPRIFERFYRSDRARSRATGGTGLGLAIVKHIVTNHGGRVDVASTLGEGSTFTLRLPSRPPRDTGGSPSDEEMTEAGGPDGPGNVEGGGGVDR